MKFHVVILAAIYATDVVFGDLLGQEFQHAAIDHVRERRQAGHLRTVNQAPPQIQQLIQAQQFRPPLVPVPPQPIPKLGPSQPVQPQQLSQTQAQQYRPQVTFASGVQQPDYRNIAAAGQAQYKKPILPQQPQYRPLPQQQPQYRPLPQQQPQYQQQLQYRPLPQQSYNPVPQLQHSSKLPAHIQQLLQYQNSLSNAIPQKG
ncbi:hypothetical protein QLX08_008828 [Tetragonisca angustula]|uniref:Activating signal cointegrator 1 complex subunit 2 homolog n=1 Tax=Tetragonisca angustula TaxID=166442 RepID=A0AAW0ZIM7_9HYME